MKTISLGKYAPIISDKEIGDDIYNQIKESLAKDDVVEIDLSEIKSMATFCAKQIFGNLFVELGSETFYERIILKNANNDIKSLIKIGIRHSISS
jgi:hypothetical protein